MRGFLIAVVLAFGSMAIGGCDREPTFRGRSESDWLKLTDDKDFTTSRQAWDALTHFNNSAASDRLLVGLKSDVPTITFICADPLAKTHPQEVLQAFQRYLADYKSHPVGAWADLRDEHARAALRTLGHVASPLSADLTAVRDGLANIDDRHAADELLQAIK